MRKLHLRESLTAGILSQQLGKSKRFQHWQIRLNLRQWCAHTILNLFNFSALRVQRVEDTRVRRLRHRDIHQIHWLQQLGTRRNLTRKKYLLCARHNLTSSAVNSIRVQLDVGNIESNAAHHFIAEHTAGGHLHKRAHHMILDLVQKLHTFGHVHNTIAQTIRRTTKRPNLSRLAHVPLELVRQATTKRLHLRRLRQHNIALAHRRRKLVQQRLRVHVQSVVLVGRLGHARAGVLAIIASLALDRLRKRHHRLRHAHLGALHVVLAQVLEANLQMQLASASDNVLSGL
mmetsp:Transcript_45157/g.74868  ORF Transcript_45157/g.74868 Transcript_45157/m.74868 type:complete len:288 (+) Transcript_45157:378-1241(+)